MVIDEQAFFQWYWGNPDPKEKALYERVEEFGPLFEDMTFQPDTCSYAMIQCKSKPIDGGDWVDDVAPIPDELEFFSYNWFHYKVEELSDCGGYYRHGDQTLCVPPEALEDDKTILHEMIHLHENVINVYPLYYHDTLLWALYSNLKKKIPMLDEIITGHAHILTGSWLYRSGGLHDILFLLKSFDLDIRMGYPLGTVFAYGREDELKKYTYTADSSETESD